MIVGIMSDVHVHRGDHSEEITALVDSINSGPQPDLLIFAGDASHRLHELKQFLTDIKLECTKCWVPGNHDVWVIDKESAEDSSDHRYNALFPRISKDTGWHYLPAKPLYLPEYDVGIIGTVGWFSGDDYSEWFDAESSDSDKKLARKFARDLEESLRHLPPMIPLIVVTHHLSHQEIPSYDPSQGNVWNTHLQDFLGRHKSRIVLVVHGHRHVRYDPVTIDGYKFVAHPFGYPHQHQSVADGYRTVEVMSGLK